MDSQSEALDLSVKVKRTIDELSTEDDDQTIPADEHLDDSKVEEEPPAKRPKFSPTGPHKAVLQWLAQNSFERSPSSMPSKEADITGQKHFRQNPVQQASQLSEMKISEKLSPISSHQSTTANFPLPAMARSLHGVTVTLQDEHLWNAFNHTGTEMIINKSGRRMFPYVTVSAEGLNPDELYNFYLEVVQLDEHCYKYVNKQWVPVAMGEKVFTNPPVPHSDSPKPGSFWMKNHISFASVKITNTGTKENRPNQILLRSMHKYMTRIHIVKESQSKDVSLPQSSMPFIFSMPATAFIAVTAYKNKAVTYMKIMNNPFAKPFRESSTEAPPRARCLRKLFNGITSEDKEEQTESGIAVPAPTQPTTSKSALPMLPMRPPPIWFPMSPYPMGPQVPIPTGSPFMFAPSPFMSPFAPFIRPFGHMPMPLPVPTQPMQ